MAHESCPACGAPLLPGAGVAGLCPACLFERAIETSGLDDATPRTALPHGATIGSFQIVRLLAKGGMARVYEAHEAGLDRAVALKVLPPEFLHDETFAQRFRQEARLLAALEHANIVPIYAGGIDDGIPWLSMRLLPGGTIEPLMGGRVAVERAILVLRGIAEALDYAHARGVIHRDVKPGNVVLNEAGHVCVADFGLARLIAPNAALTSTGIIVGTPHYMAPEQALGQPLDHRCDLYSLGVIAYEMLSGVKPFDSAEPMAVLTKHINEPVPAPARDRVPAAMARVLLKALEKKPADRWPTGMAFVDALEASARQPAPSPHWRTVAVLATVAAAALVIWTSRPSWLPLVKAPSTVAPVIQSRPTTSGLVPWPARISQVAPAVAAVASGTPPSLGPVNPGDKGERRDEGGSSTVVGDDNDTRGDPTTGTTPNTTFPVENPGAGNPSPSSSITNSSSGTPTSGATPAATVDVIIKPNRTHNVDPAYPQVARAAQLQGDVVLEARIGADGRVTAVKIVRSAHRVFEEAATKAVMQYRYTPQLRNGRPEPATVQETVSFRFVK